MSPYLREIHQTHFHLGPEKLRIHDTIRLLSETTGSGVPDKLSSAYTDKSSTTSFNITVMLAWVRVVRIVALYARCEMQALLDASILH